MTNNKKIIFFSILMYLFIINACVYVNTKSPYDIDINQTDLGEKKGISEAYSFLWLFAWGDASYAKAAENGDIKVLKHADQEFLQLFFGSYTRWRIIVYGD